MRPSREKVCKSVISSAGHGDLICLCMEPERKKEFMEFIHSFGFFFLCLTEFNQDTRFNWHILFKDLLFR